MRTDVDVLTFDTEMDTNVSAALRAERRETVDHLVNTDPSHLFSPCPASVHLDDLGVSRLGPQEPRVPAVL